MTRAVDLSVAMLHVALEDLREGDRVTCRVDILELMTISIHPSERKPNKYIPLGQEKLQPDL
eukprot:6474557-Amphidinium_carterae.2